MLNENIHTEYPAYNGMNRPALFFGAPLMPMVIFIFVIMMIAMIAQLIIGKAGLLLVGLLIPIYFGLKTISQNDDQAFSIYALEAKWLLRRMAAGTKLATFTLHAGKYGRHTDDYKNYWRLLGPDAQPHGGNSGFRPQNLPTRHQ